MIDPTEEWKLHQKGWKLLPSPEPGITAINSFHGCWYQRHPSIFSYKSINTFRPLFSVTTQATDTSWPDFINFTYNKRHDITDEQSLMTYVTETWIDMNLQTNSKLVEDDKNRQKYYIMYCSNKRLSWRFSYL